MRKIYPCIKLVSFNFLIVLEKFINKTKTVLLDNYNIQ